MNLWLVAVPLLIGGGVGIVFYVKSRDLMSSLAVGLIWAVMVLLIALLATSSLQGNERAVDLETRWGFQEVEVNGHLFTAKKGNEYCSGSFLAEGSQVVELRNLVCSPVVRLDR